MGDRLNITRRDFMNGVAMSLAAGATASPLELLAASPYPPALTGMRGSHAGSFEVAHAVAWGGKKFSIPSDLTDDIYDLVVVGGGVSGLSAALMYHQRAGEGKRVLVLDNHDDFGGHAKRNEFNVDGTHLIGYGGSMTIDSPSQWSKVSSKVLADIGIETDPFYEYFDMEFSERNGLGTKLYFSESVYGKDVLTEHPLSLFGSATPDGGFAELVAQFPISEEARAAFLKLLTDDSDWLADHSQAEKREILLTTSTTAFLHKYGNVPKEVTDVFRDMPRGIWGVGWDACSAMEGRRWGVPGPAGVELVEAGSNWREERDPYICHFPDGNAGVARSPVRVLNPKAVPGSTMEDLVLSKVDYGLLDNAGNATRIRLNSTAVDIRHTGDERFVDVTYQQNGDTQRVRGKHVVYAGYHSLLPHICSELRPQQVEAINSVTKVPLVYINIAIRNWKAFAELGVDRVSVSQPTLMNSFTLDFPVSMGGYEFAHNPEQPTVIHGTFVPCAPDSGLNSIEQHKLGRRQLYEMSFADFEREIVSQMGGALGGGGFDSDRDIAAITVNRWPHGYAYEYNELFDGGLGPSKGPHLIAREQVGRISIANSDASAYAYLNGAIDAADRAVNEQLAS